MGFTTPWQFHHEHRRHPAAYGHRKAGPKQFPQALCNGVLTETQGLKRLVEETALHHRIERNLGQRLTLCGKPDADPRTGSRSETGGACITQPNEPGDRRRSASYPGGGTSAGIESGSMSMWTRALRVQAMRSGTMGSSVGVFRMLVVAGLPGG